MESMDNVTRLYLGNLSWGVTDEQLKELFDTVCEGCRVRANRDRETGQSRGFGFATVPADMVETIIATLNGTILVDRKLLVDLARPKGVK